MMIDYGITPPTCRKELEHNLNLVIEDSKRTLDSGKVELIRSKLWATLPHLERLAYLPNRRINLATVNEMLRLQANTIASINLVRPIQ